MDKPNVEDLTNKGDYKMAQYVAQAAAIGIEDAELREELLGDLNNARSVAKRIKRGSAKDQVVRSLLVGSSEVIEDASSN